MGEVELDQDRLVLTIHAELIFYGNAANEMLAQQIASDVETYWNEPAATLKINSGWYQVRFSIKGFYEPGLTETTVYENTDPRKNYFRIEPFAHGNISFVDGIHSNTGYFKLENLLNNSTTAAHEFGHTIGLVHPHVIDIRGKGIPGIMYPRGTIVDPHFQYDPSIPAGDKGGTMNPFYRKVLQKDIEDLQLQRLSFNKNGFAVLGGFTSVWHDAHQAFG